MKKILLIALMIFVMTTVFVISASADTIVPSDSNEYGELTTFDTPIGRTEISNLKADGTEARTVLFDGTNYYTVPTTYLLSKNPYESGGILLQFDFSAINTALSKNFSKTSVIRCEVPASITLLAGTNQNFNGFSNIIEIKLSSNISFVGNSQYKAFAGCSNLVEIDLSMVNFNYPNSTFSLLEYCKKLEKVTLPDAFVENGTPVDYAINYMFNGCYELETIENYEDFFKGVTVVGYKAFMQCYKLHNIVLWDGIKSISGRAFQECYAMTEFIIPDSCTAIGTTETVFASCTSLKKLVLPKQASFGDYCFEKCSKLTDVWMPTEASTFGKQVFGQCGSSLNVNFYFATATNTVEVTNTEFNNDPYLTAINATSDARLKFNTPLSTKCSVFIGDHTKPANITSCLVGGNCSVCSTAFEPYATEHTKGGETLTFPNGLTANGIYTYDCTNPGCTIADIVAGDKDGRDVVAPVFTAKGYSTNEDKNAINGGYSVDLDSLSLYERLIGELSYGIVIANANAFGANSFFNAENKVNTDKALQVEMDKQYASFDCSINFGTKTNMELDLVICAYVIDANGVTFIQAESGSDVTIGAKGFKSVTLAQVVALQPAVSKED